MNYMQYADGLGKVAESVGVVPNRIESSAFPAHGRLPTLFPHLRLVMGLRSEVKRCRLPGLSRLTRHSPA